MNGLNAVAHMNNGFKYTCCGKLLVLKNRRQMIRYIVDKN